ncbi:hypothetical protein BKA64DRAFT_129747 [Cadophora sp. MPI-SDFR-AT-0126]|nr:hypothetical protein BKA64DRAFT_129747 [Leotiomycetes sp. MPI-SDFR-AT-0126]
MTLGHSDFYDGDSAIEVDTTPNKSDASSVTDRDSKYGRTWRNPLRNVDMKKWLRSWLYVASRHGKEGPKVVFSLKRRLALIEFTTLHLFPIAITFALLSLYLGQVFWTPPWPETNTLNALQFAAKVHESLIVASLTGILLHHVRYRLVAHIDKSSGIALGLVAAPFQLTSPTYLISSDFTSLLGRSKRLSSRDAASLLLFVYVFALASIAGPSSAIVMLPRLDWWPFPLHSSPNASASLTHYYVNATFQQIFPNSITADFHPVACSYVDIGANSSTCPRQGLDAISKNMPAVTTLGYQDEQTFNLTVQLQGGNLQLPRTLYGVMTSRNVGSTATGLWFYQSLGYATTPIDTANFLTEELLRNAGGNELLSSKTQSKNGPVQFRPKAQDAITGSIRSWKQPLVFAHCSQRAVFPRALMYNISSDPFLFRATREEGVSVAVNPNSVPASINNTSGLAFLSPSALSMQPPFNLSSAFAFQKGNESTLCLISAWWIDSDISLSTARSTILPEFNIDKPQLSHMKEASSSVLSMDVAWLNTLDRAAGVDNTTDRGYFYNMTDFCSSPGNAITGGPFGYGTPPSPQCLSTGIALLIAEGMARSTYKFAHYQIGVNRTGRYFQPLLGTGDINSPGTLALTSDMQLGNSTRVTFDIKHKVYSYGFRSVTTYLAFTVLLLYVATVAVHMGIILLGERWSSKAWSGLGELLVLALQSPSPSEGLRNTGGGVECAETWTMRATVEEVSQDIGAGMVVRKEEGLRETWDVKIRSRALRPDSKYS